MISDVTLAGKNRVMYRENQRESEFEWKTGTIEHSKGGSKDAMTDTRFNPGTLVSVLATTFCNWA